MSNTAFPAATIVGYPRVGRFRELKKAQEAFWKVRSPCRSYRIPPLTCSAPTLSA